jgi:hypothetical protein
LRIRRLTARTSDDITQQPTGDVTAFIGRSGALEERVTVALKKSELYSHLWASCDELRGGMDASQYKDYVLFLLFIKYVSDKTIIPAFNLT